MGVRRYIHSRSVLTKLLLTLLVAISVVIAGGSVVSYWVIEQSFNQQLTASESKALTAANEHMSYLLKDIENLSDKVYINRALREILSSRPEALADTIRLYQNENELSLSYIDSFFTETQLLYRWMKYDAYVLGLNGYRRRYSSASNAQTNVLLGDVVATDWYPRVVALSGQPMLVDGQESGLPHLSQRILYVRLLKDIDSGQGLGLFILTFSKHTLDYIYRNLMGEDTAMLGIVDAGGRRVWGDELGELAARESLGGSSGSYPAALDGRNYRVLFDPIAGTPWYLVKVLDVDRMLSFTARLKWMIFGLWGLATLLVFLFSARVTRHLYRPINNLLGAMRQVRGGDFDTAMLDPGGDDEIGQLNRGFNDMARELKGMVDRLIEEQNQKRRAEIQSLQAQIRPHFLYNTLTSIRCVVSQGDTHTAQRMIIALVKLLKCALGGEEELFSVERELDTLRSYALISQIRYANFDIEYIVDEEARTCLVPRMILQPLVENAIVHGIDGTTGGIRIRVYVYVQDDCLIAEVVDDGLGIAPEARARLADAQGRVSGREDSVGLRNVSERIRLTFGPEYGIRLVDTPERGAHIRLTMPVRHAGGQIA